MKRINMEDKLYIGTISTVLPRQCGIASYNQDMIDSLRAVRSIGNRTRFSDWGLHSIIQEPLDYDDSIKRHIDFEVQQDNPESWRELGNYIAAQAQIRREKGISGGYFINHEFGIYGKSATEDNLVPLLEKMHNNHIATITVLHTILSNPNHHVETVTKGILDYTDKVICLSPSAINILQYRYDAPRGKLIYIPHGVPEIDIKESRQELKRKSGLIDRTGKEKKVFASAGYLSPGKGLQYPLEAFSRLLDEQTRDSLFFLIAGVTHPEVLRFEGEKYRDSLVELAKNLNIPGAVINAEGKISDLYGRRIRNLRKSNLAFFNKHLKEEELQRIMKMSDFGVIGNLGKEQISSGPGAYWIGNSRITIATESPFFKDLEKEGIGLLVRFESADDFEDRFRFVLSRSQEDIEELEYAASDKGSTMSWTIIGQMYLNLMEKIVRHKSGLENRIYSEK